MPLSCWRKTHNRKIKMVYLTMFVLFYLNLVLIEIPYHSLTFIALNNKNFFYGGPFEIKLNQSKFALKNCLLKTSPINGTKLYQASNGR